MPQVKGSMLRSKLVIFELETSKDAAARLREKLNLRTVLDSSWYDLTEYDRLMHEIKDHFTAGDEIFHHYGYKSAALQFETAYRSTLYKTLEDTLVNQPILHSLLNRPARMEVKIISPTYYQLITYLPKSVRSKCLAAKGFLHWQGEHFNKPSLDISEEYCSAFGHSCCVMNVKWQG